MPDHQFAYTGSDAPQDDARRNDLRSPSQLLRNLTDLFVSRSAPTSAEVMRYDDIACRLVPEADSTALAYTAARLAGHSKAPAVLLDTLARCDRTCAKILAEHCARLAPTFLLDFARGEDAGLAAAVARRHSLTQTLAKALSLRSEPEVLHALAANSRVNLEGDLLARLIQAAGSDKTLASLILARVDDLDLIAPLFFDAGPDLRRKLIMRAEKSVFHGQDIKRVRLIGPALTNWLLRKNPEENWERIAGEFARLTGLNREIAFRLVTDETGDGLALLFAAVGMPTVEATRFLLHCPPAISHSYERIRYLVSIIESLPAHAALALIAKTGPVQTSSTESKPLYQALSDVRANALPGRAETAFTRAGYDRKLQDSKINKRQQA